MKKILKTVLLISLFSVSLGSTIFQSSVNSVQAKTSSSVSKKHKKKINKNTTSGLKKYLNKKGSITIKSVKVSNNIIVIRTSGVTFNGSFLGAGDIDNLTDVLKYANGSTLNTSGIALVQKDKYEDSKGNESTEPSYIIYYDKNTLNSINFKNYQDVVEQDETKLISNASGYYINTGFDNGNKWQFEGLSYVNGSDTITNLYDFLSN